MKDHSPPGTPRVESRWPPAIALLLLVVLVDVLPLHVIFLPVWVGYVCLVAVLAALAAAGMTNGNLRCLRIERTLIVFLAAFYVFNTGAQLADMGKITADLVNSVTLNCQPVDYNKDGKVDGGDVMVTTANGAPITGFTLMGTKLTFVNALPIGQNSIKYYCAQ